MTTKLLIIDVAALGWDLLQQHGTSEMAGLSFAPAEAAFPALTCPAQAAFRTAGGLSQHGMVANGLFARDLRKVMFWEQAASLVAGARIWSGLSERGGKTAMLFWQQSMGENVDVVLTPAPIHKHHGGMIQDCYCQPPGLYAKLCRQIGSPFKLRQYWGPLASAKVGNWIARATRCVLADRELGLDVCMVYLPTLDYDLQRYGPNGPKAAAALEELRSQLTTMLAAADEFGYEVIVFGDYAITEVTQPPAMPNLLLRDAGLFQTREVRGRLYADLAASRAVAVTDHQIANVYIADPADVPRAREVLRQDSAIAQVLDVDQQQAIGVRHANSGELLLMAAEGAWLAYPWWPGRRAGMKLAPDYATHVDIHSKPGYDPCELFFSFGWPPMSVSQDVGRIRGTHGLVGAGREIAWASTIEFETPPAALVDLATSAKNVLDEKA